MSQMTKPKTNIKFHVFPGMEMQPYSNGRSRYVKVLKSSMLPCELDFCNFPLLFQKNSEAWNLISHFELKVSTMTGAVLIWVQFC